MSVGRAVRGRSAGWILLAAWGVLAASAGVPLEPPSEPLLGGLSPSELRWLNLVDPLLTEEELSAFLSLRHAYQRKRFIEHFWRARDPFPDTAVNEFHEHWKHRVEVAEDRFGGVVTDRGRAYLLAGPATFIHSNLCPELLSTNEVWVYRREDSRDIALVFVVAPGPDPYRLWSPARGLTALFSGGEIPLDDSEARRRMSSVCRRSRESVALLADAVDLKTLVDLSEDLPQPSPEWVATFLSRTTEVPLGAEKLSARLELAFPGRYGSRTVVEGLLVVPRGEAQASAAERSTYNLLVDGDVLRGEELFETFRYRFDLAREDLAGEDIPLMVRRYLRPGSYELILRLQDLNGERFFRTQRALDVPRVTAAAPASPEASSAEPIPGSPPPAGTLDRPEPPSVQPPSDGLRRDHTLEILPLPEHLTIGRQRVETLVSGEGVSRVAFVLDGREIMTKGEPPFSVELDFGRAPRPHVLEAVAYEEAGTELARARLSINAGPPRFAVRLLEPRRGRTYRDRLEARAEVDLPRGEALERVEFFLNERRVATLYQPPFVQPVLLPPDNGIVYVRAVAVLEDGHSAEDLVIVNAPRQLDELQVDLVELYVSVLDRHGDSVEGLEQGEFRVFEDRVEQKILRFERVADLPINAAVVIDASQSMGEEMRQVERAALEFFRRVVQPKDRAAVIVFNDQPSLRVPLTNSHGALAGGLSGVLAEGETALYDSVIYGLYYLGGLRGKRTLVVLSDGEDSISRYSVDQALDFARYSGTAIYAIGVGLSAAERRAQVLLKQLASETGGRYYPVGRGRDLSPVYEEIEAELRSQYLIAYQPSLEGRGEVFRPVEVRLERRDLTVRTIPGYFR